MKKLTIGLSTLLVFSGGCVAPAAIKAPLGVETPVENRNDPPPVHDTRTSKQVDSEQTPSKATWLIENPILLEGYIAGDVSGGVFRPVDWNSIDTSRFHGYEADEIIVPLVRVPERIRFYGRRGATDLETPLNARLESNCGGQPLLGYRWQESDHPFTLLGMDAAWNAAPRASSDSKAKDVWKNALKKLLLKEGKPSAPVNIQTVEQVDLLGDGKADIVVFASNLKRTKKCAGNDDVCWATSAGEVVMKESSYGIVAFAMDGQGPLRSLLYYYSGDQPEGSLDEWLFADVDGDNTLEFVYRVSFYEGWYAEIISFDGQLPQKVLTLECFV